MNGKFVLVIGLLAVCLLSCNHGISPAGENNEKKQAKRDRSKQSAVDSAEYIDFTVKKNNAHAIRKEDMLNLLNGITYKNVNSSIRIKALEGTVEITSDSGQFNGKNNCQVYGVFAIDIKAASDDCLYIRKDPQKEGFVLIDGNIFRNDAIPDLAVCIPLYGYSGNRIEVSPVMNGYIVMPSGTYWKQ